MKYEILKLLRKKKTYISGEEMSEKLGITRSAVWKHINALRKDGYKISSTPSKGYFLDFAPDRLNPEELTEAVPGKVYYCRSTDRRKRQTRQKMVIAQGCRYMDEYLLRAKYTCGECVTADFNCRTCCVPYNRRFCYKMAQ